MKELLVTISEQRFVYLDTFLMLLLSTKLAPFVTAVQEMLHKM